MINAIFSDEANSYSIMTKFLEGLYPVSPGAVLSYGETLKKCVEIVGVSR